MSPLSLMEWNSKSPIQWDWENLFNETNEISKKSRLEDWELEGEKGIDSASFFSSGSGGKSSKSPSNNSSAAAEAALPPEIEPLLGLKLGKRTYFEDVCGGSGPKTAAFAVIPGGNSNSPPKKSKSGGNTLATRCQVEGCNLDLSSAKDYHRKHRVCENHSKSPKVIVAGLERRFCQQCSRFHGLSEFDQKKRSCRRRLSDHNARRRKPQPEAVQLNPARLTTSFYDERQQMGFVWNRVNPSLTVEGPSSTKFTITKEYTLKPGKGPLNTNQLHFPSNEPIPLHASKTIFPSKLKVAAPEVLNQGLEESMVPTSVDATQDLYRALSLLSTNSWGSSDPNHSAMPQVRVQAQARAEPVLQNIPQGVPIPPRDYWRTEQHSQNDANNYFTEFQLLRSPYDSDFYSGDADQGFGNAVELSGFWG